MTLMKMKMKVNKKKNSLLAFVVGDCLGVPFEFRDKGTFKCTKFIGYGTHNQPPGTWSDDTSITLCLLNSLSSIRHIDQKIEIYKENLRNWLSKGVFTCDGYVFDIGYQTRESIRTNFTLQNPELQGNGALFYSLPLAIHLINCNEIEARRSTVNKFVSVTHNSSVCKVKSFELEEILRDLLLMEDKCNLTYKAHINTKSMDVSSTLSTVLQFYNEASSKKTSILTDLCGVVNSGDDSDTNAALVGAMLGTQKLVSKTILRNIRRFDEIETTIDTFLDVSPN